MENTLERIAKCRYNTKMDKRSGFWQVDLTAAAQELLAFITPKGRVFKWKVIAPSTPGIEGMHSAKSRRLCLSGWLMPQRSSRSL